MNTARFLSALIGGVTRKPWLTLALAMTLALAGAALALGLSPSASTSTFVSSSSPQYRATQRYYQSFGEEPVDVVVRGSLQQLLLSSDIDRLVGLEGCLSGNVPASALASEGGTGGPCGQLAKARTVKVVLGPGTFVNEAAEQIDEQLTSQTKQAEAQARAAQRVVTQAALAQGHSAAEAHTLGAQASSITMKRFQEGIATLALQYGLTSKPSLDDPEFVSTLVFDSSKPAGTPKQRFAYLFPSPNAALISVRMKPGLSEAARRQTIALIGRAVAMRQWRLAHGETYLVTGEPAIVADLTSSISHSIELLGLAVLAVMAIALSLIFRERPRLLPLGVALLASALTFGALALVSSSLTVAQVAVLPVLVGLAVDYAIQFQSRVGEILAAGMSDGRAAISEAARVSAPTIATAAAASVAATLVLTLSPVPMVRGFGVLLAVGIAIAFACALTVGSAALVVAGHRGSESFPSGRPSDPTDGVVSSGTRSPALGRGGRALTESVERSRDLLAPAWRGARELLTDNPLTRFISRTALDRAVRHPGRVLGVGLALAALGWGLDTQTKVQTSIEKLVPQDTASLRNLNTLERLSGVGGVVNLTIGGANVLKPATIEWMSAYESAMLKRFGYTANRGCGKARLCPAFSLPDLFQHEGASSKLSSAEVNGLLDAIPPYFSQAVIAPGRRLASLAFGIKLMSLDEQQRVIEAMRASLHPPRGVSARLVGLSVLAAQANAQVASPWRRLQTLLAGLAAVALVLLIAFAGDVRRALTPLTPIVLASGWSALILFVVRVPLNPMSLTLGALVIAITTEFSVLLSERHRQERLAGHDVAQALRRTYRHTGAAVAASGVTAIAGFGVLVLSDIAMLRDFGLVTVIDLSVSLMGVLVALPAALVLADRSRVGVEWPTLRMRRLTRHEPT
ncbi:MAG TPA: MMPL family transporter [Solirubrobacteraceae bacterium]|nr:MMPL family transporter [Solirubrobacteraceae bacterium]